VPEHLESPGTGSGSRAVRISPGKPPSYILTLLQRAERPQDLEYQGKVALTGSLGFSASHQMSWQETSWGSTFLFPRRSLFEALPFQWIWFSKKKTKTLSLLTTKEISSQFFCQYWLANHCDIFGLFFFFSQSQGTYVAFLLVLVETTLKLQLRWEFHA